ncbi:hypothetical protein NDU88_003871 [Pleurodeles waltl]|uniref:Uncharacterized protein n=1 Tax=Pleurodeles waltl TaxID=8319 RepID=A0AAV7TSC8_PLEWA|nr:hypothetical protein NDU88_003871 [Pleurodeles waltl]
MKTANKQYNDCSIQLLCTDMSINGQLCISGRSGTQVRRLLHLPQLNKHRITTNGQAVLPEAHVASLHSVTSSAPAHTTKEFSHAVNVAGDVAFQPLVMRPLAARSPRSINLNEALCLLVLGYSPSRQASHVDRNGHDVQSDSDVATPHQ